MPDQPDDKTRGTAPMWQFDVINVTPSPEVAAALSKIPGLSPLVRRADGEVPGD